MLSRLLRTSDYGRTISRSLSETLKILMPFWFALQGTMVWTNTQISLAASAEQPAFMC